MPARIVTQEAVFAAAEALAAAGQRPTLTTVQERTGGSYTTVKQFLDLWQNQRKAAPALAEPPAEVAAEAQRLATSLWQVAATLADQRVAEVHAESERAVAEARAGQTQAEAAIERLEGELESATEAQAAAEAVAGELRGQVDEMRRAAEVAQARAGELEQRAGEQARQLERQAAELAEVREQLLEQARQQGELEALRRQVKEQQELLARLGQARPGRHRLHRDDPPAGDSQAQ